MHDSTLARHELERVPAEAGVVRTVVVRKEGALQVTVSARSLSHAHLDNHIPGDEFCSEDVFHILS